MNHLSRSILSGLLCAAMAFAFCIVGCNENTQTKKRGDSGAVTEGDQTFSGKKTFIGNYGMVGTNATAMIVHSCANSGPATSILFGTPGLGGPRIRQLDQVVDVLGVSTAMQTQVPKGAVILSVQGYVVQGLIASGNTVTWALGPAGSTINAYGYQGCPTAADSLLLGGYSNFVGPVSALGSANAVTVYAAQTGGTSVATGAFTGGQVRVVVTYIDCLTLGGTTAE